ncbi:MAG: hypothetical protein ACOX3V_02780 [Bacillota bacterium]
MMVLGAVSTLAFFLFIPLKKQSGPRSAVSNSGLFPALSLLGRATMMVAFGSSFGFVVMARLSYLIGRLQFLFTRCIPLIPQ